MLIYFSGTELLDDVLFHLGDACMPVFQSLTCFGTSIAYGCQMMGVEAPTGHQLTLSLTVAKAAEEIIVA